ncbi:uncharacterized protein LOC113166286 [Anabas testudineus]|uniref:uncharacterized protein LOC113166285 n=1 Tax=Anabas testudineus TaxID=64144 RepID=UPI000E45B240|nr:uncharacterized protein LOC113166285 [Anabas testudineus]XP_026222130.1 uncharacterized protein LOC113166285 [Anabas testudineus]XP_026222131.1 uncharacterized protein LOC113166286 [Anabas testudineus]
MTSKFMEIALEALGTVLNASVTSTQKQRREGNNKSTDDSPGVVGPLLGFVPSLRSALQVLVGGAALALAATQPQLSVKTFISTLLEADETSQLSRSFFNHIQSILTGGPEAPYTVVEDLPTGNSHIIDEDEFFAPEFDYDFTKLKDTETFYRGGEVYERPCGWRRLALKVLDKYEDNTWLGTRYRSTQSVPGEWPVSYHGTSMKGAEGIIEGYFKPGPGDQYGRGIYSTPHIAEALSYAKTFTSRKTGKTYNVILQNRINPEYRKKYKNDKYWLIPIHAGKSAKEEQERVKKAIRPYGILLKEV